MGEGSRLRLSPGRDLKKIIELGYETPMVSGKSNHYQ